MSKAYLRLVTFTVLLPSWMALIDSMIVNVGLDTVAGNLGVSLDEAAWISSIYVLAGLFAMPLTGWFAANVGRKRAFLITIGVFTAGSLLCAVSTSLPMLVAMRFVQGLGGGLMMPLAMAALVDAYPPEQLGTAFKFYGVSVMVGPALGPALGGWILANASWPWIFIVNVPLGILSLFMVSSVLREQSERAERSPFDWTSLAIMAAGFCALQYVVQEGPRQEWLASPAIGVALAVAVAALGAFVIVQLRAAVPFVDLRPLAIPSYAVGMVLALITGIGFTGSGLVVPLYMQDVLRYAPDLAGLIMVPSSIGAVIGTELSGRASRWIPAPLLCGLSLAICAGATWWFALLGDRAGFEHALLPRFVQGLGLGLLYVPLNVLIMADVPKRLVDAASGLGALTRQVGTSLGFAILATLVVRWRIASTSLTASRMHRDPLSGGAGLDALRQWFLAHGHAAGEASSLAFATAQELLARAATTAAYSEAFVVMALLFAGSIPWLLLFQLVPRKEAESA